MAKDYCPTDISFYRYPFPFTHRAENRGTVDMDHISLFPADTWKGRENGLRKDLAQALYDLNPEFSAFPAVVL